MWGVDSFGGGSPCTTEQPRFIDRPQAKCLEVKVLNPESLVKWISIYWKGRSGKVLSGLCRVPDVNEAFITPAFMLFDDDEQLG